MKTNRIKIGLALIASALLVTITGASSMYYCPYPTTTTTITSTSTSTSISTSTSTSTSSSTTSIQPTTTVAATTTIPPTTTISTSSVSSSQPTENSGAGDGPCAVCQQMEIYYTTSDWTTVSYYNITTQSTWVLGLNDTSAPQAIAWAPTFSPSWYVSQGS